MSGYTWRELERADMDTAAAHAFDMEYRAEQIASEARKQLARMEHIVDGLGEVKGEIVRCRDCVFMFDWSYGRPLCKLWAFNDPDESESDSGNALYPKVEPDGFCAWGERNDGKAAS